MSQVMLDIETMGNGSNAALIAIGAVAFNIEDGVSSKFYTEVNLQSSIDAGMVVDGSTVMWWLQQSNEARSAFEHNEKAPTLKQALIDFNQWLITQSVTEVWGNGAVFDNVIVLNAFRACGLNKPWSHKFDRCYRTIRATHPEPSVARVGTYHNAVDDAETQALRLIETLRGSSNEIQITKHNGQSA